MIIDSIRLSLVYYQHVMMLKEKKGNRYLPILIGEPEAKDLKIKLEGLELGRPMTHDLICTFSDIAEWKIKSAKIYKLENDCFYGVLDIDSSKKHFEVDCRPSDAIAIAILKKIPILANEEVLEKAGSIFNQEPDKPLDIIESTPTIKTDIENKIKISGIKCHRCESTRIYSAYSDRKICGNCGLIFT